MPPGVVHQPIVDIAFGPVRRGLRCIALDLTRSRWSNWGMERWNAGDMGCGQLVFELYRRVSELEAGERLEVTAEDIGAVTDLPAWCRMTGHALISADHPTYVIERNRD